MRAVDGTRHKDRRKKILRQTKGFHAGRRRLWRTAKDAWMKAGLWAWRDRRRKKRDMRSLWIVRLNAACRLRGISYSRFIHGLKKAQMQLNRKQLSELAIHDPDAFNAIVEKVHEALQKP
ncbi:MAG: 50S ribosomal protein L20 [Leptospiraceae bacterium]|nr:50S ribosomal protein L20 [Leptospiraceae bacterium]MDW8306495.1 50S ribosomal protein L20 [Leptospiraceae bacterium]